MRWCHLLDPALRWVQPATASIRSLLADERARSDMRTETVVSIGDGGMGGGSVRGRVGLRERLLDILGGHIFGHEFLGPLLRAHYRRQCDMGRRHQHTARSAGWVARRNDQVYRAPTCWATERLFLVPSALNWRSRASSAGTLPCAHAIAVCSRARRGHIIAMRGCNKLQSVSLRECRWRCVKRAWGGSQRGLTG
eukprot:COSAG01_NODE_977_length_12361_cov_167.523483_7_plen_195_part_00